MSKRDFLTLLDLTAAELRFLVEKSLQTKRHAVAGTMDCPIMGKSVGLLFEKPSTRTRVSFEVAIYQLGGQTIFLTTKDVQLSRGETLHDTARVLSRYLSALVVRTYSQETLEVLAAEASIPVINALTDKAHPCQVLSDLMTIREESDGGRVRVAYFGDGNNVANSLIAGCAMMGMDLVLACPEGYDPDPVYLSEGVTRARENGGSVKVVRDPVLAAKGSSFLYTDVWTSMGQEEESERRRRDLSPYQLNRALLEAAAPGAKIMHCLPAHRGEEITDEMMEHERSIVIDQAENRLHAQKALLLWLLGGE